MTIRILDVRTTDTRIDTTIMEDTMIMDIPDTGDRIMMIDMTEGAAMMMLTVDMAPGPDEDLMTGEKIMFILYKTYKIIKVSLFGYIAI